MEPDDCLRVARSFLAEKGFVGEILFCMVGGSQAYNLAHADSDIDYVGVYISSTNAILSMHTAGSAMASAPISTQLDSTGPDVTLYEVKQFLQFLCNGSRHIQCTCFVLRFFPTCRYLSVCAGNPFCMEMMFTERYCWMSPEWALLRNWRRDPISKATIAEYIQYCRHRLEAQQSRRKVGKRIYHVVRLLNDATRLVQGQDPVIFLPEGPQRDFLVQIRSLKDPSSLKIEENFASLVANIEMLLPTSPLPDVADTTRLDAWLVQLRIARLE